MKEKQTKNNQQSIFFLIEISPTNLSKQKRKVGSTENFVSSVCGWFLFVSWVGPYISCKRIVEKGWIGSKMFSSGISVGVCH